MENLNEKLGSLWASVIEEIDFNLMENSIRMNLKLTENGNVEYFEIAFKNVSSYSFLKNKGENRFSFDELEDGDYLELTSIDYFENGIGEISMNSSYEWTKEYYSSANFVVEIWSSLLLIEADIFELNKKTYTHLMKF
ncbi:hypothetical protein PZE06_10130 [Robertmurraya sp. DFI.2.37]|uniref:YxiG family protein n=1 Tax=Robertmurraya sp. DFI.2.37 TaxID=3031819 RepID=UPI0012455EAE|nr:hypothetical protein [Robertmurraya sp. DFI.2.37]MDF1508546.1 hypothetical protein [Robertmurraya sp. DFI.2.37]